MHEEFLILRDWLSMGGSYGDPPALANPVHQRLVRALSTASVDRPVGRGDIIALVGHALGCEDARVVGGYPWLLVPAPGELKDDPRIAWPTRDMWQDASLGVSRDGESFRLTLRQWNPSWLPAAGLALTASLFAEEARRTYEDVPGDPFLSAAGLTRYRCDAQREATRAILSVPEGSTVLVNLPTGAGKSLCAQLPALLLSQHAGVSVIVVPTTSLALDQERAMSGLVPHRMAYVGGESANEKEWRSGIRTRVRDGSQRIVFTSPESSLGSLRPALYDAARRGMLRLVVIDEAHMVEQWGDEFRSSFQELAGLFRDLRRCVPDGVSPFTTVLLTATLTETALDTLETLFGGGESPVIVSAAQLRPEPSYWAVETTNEEARAEAILEAVRHLPRPLMLYLTEPADADAWARCLRAQGYERIDVVTGRTPNETRARVIQRWRDADTDIIVATSAFGLGVDQGNVRAVLHATVPENVDRFYQEVGRGGRDGKASLSLVIYTKEDVERAKSMNHKKIIGIERGRERWSRMFEARESLGGDRIRVPIDARPNLSDGIDMDNDLNRAWNVRTLTLMSRVGLLDFDAEAPPNFVSSAEAGTSESEASENYARAFAELQRHRVVCLNHHGTVTYDVWEREVEPARRRTTDADNRSHAAMLELLRGERCAGEVLVQTYTIPARSGNRRRPEVAVAIACGGCAYCRAHGRRPYATPLPTAMPQWPTASRTGPVLQRLRGGGGAVAIFYSDLPAPHRLSRIVRWLVGQGVRLAVAPASVLPSLAGSLDQPSANVFAYPLDTFRFIHAPSLPSLIFLPPGVALEKHLQHAFDRTDGARPVRVLLASKNTVDAEVSRRLLRSTLRCRTYDLEEFSMQVGL